MFLHSRLKHTNLNSFNDEFILLSLFFLVYNTLHKTYKNIFNLLHIGLTCMWYIQFVRYIYIQFNQKHSIFTIIYTIDSSNLRIIHLTYSAIRKTCRLKNLAIKQKLSLLPHEFAAEVLFIYELSNQEKKTRHGAKTTQLSSNVYANIIHSFQSKTTLEDLFFY